VTPDLSNAAAGVRHRTLVLAALLSAIIVVLGAATIVHRHHDAETVDDAPVAVARQEAINFFTLDYRRIDQNLAAVTSLATEPFKSQFTAKESTLKAGVLAKHLTIAATTPTNPAGLEYENGSAAIVLVAVDEVIGEPSQTPQLNHYRMRVHLRQVDGHWLVSQIQQVG
jgi:Mce-associated membrane protein